VTPRGGAGGTDEERRVNTEAREGGGKVPGRPFRALSHERNLGRGEGDALEISSLSLFDRRGRRGLKTSARGIVRGDKRLRREH